MEELLADKAAAPGDKKGGKGGSKPASAAAKKGTGKDGKGGKGEPGVLQNCPVSFPASCHISCLALLQTAIFFRIRAKICPSVCVCLYSY